jgi:diaminopimelate epimerase
MRIPFTKAHGDSNDFLLTWAADARVADFPAAARAMCDRHTGLGADGWLLVSPPAPGGTDCQGSIRLFNSDGSEAELSGNGTRCAAAFLVDAGLARDQVCIQTAAGTKQLRLLRREDLRFLFEMNMGRPQWKPSDIRFSLDLSSGPREVTILDVGNPQCAVVVENFDFDWRATGREIEGHPHFPKRTNVSFARMVDEHTLEARFYERGAGETLSSGTGSTGAVASAILRHVARSPVRVLTPAGVLELRWDDEIFLTGPAEIVAGGEFYL